MILSQTAEYALRASSTLALCDRKDPVSAAVLSERSDVPNAYLSKIMRQLVTAGIVEAHTGPRGGFKYAKDIKDVSILDILEAINFEFDQSHCVFGWKNCSAVAPCPLHDSYSKLKKAFFKWATETSIQNIKSKSKDFRWE